MTDATPTEDRFSANLLTSIYEVFIAPELARRGIEVGAVPIERALVEIDPDASSPRVQLNEEVPSPTVRARVTRSIDEGEKVRDGDVDHIVDLAPPDSISPNSGYVYFITFRDEHYVRFDFRYNRQRASALVSRAEEFVRVARLAAGVSAAVACDLAFSAAELSVQAQMQLQQSDRKHHARRQEWLDQWVALDNAPTAHAEVLRELYRLRAPSRYGDGSAAIDEDWLVGALATIEEMVNTARLSAE